MTLSVFDLDETLIAADSASLFCQYLVEHQLIDANFVEKDAAFMRLYNSGQLDINDYIAFFVDALRQYSVEDIEALLPTFLTDHISHVIYPEAVELLIQLKEQGHTIVIVSATAEFIVTAIAKLLGVEHVLAIQLETDVDNNGDDFYNGKIKGTPSFRDGKISRLQAWVAKHNETMDGAYFYSDSINDVPLLQLIDNPVATNPDTQLRQIANQQNWKIVRWEKPQLHNVNHSNHTHFTQLETHNV